MINMANNDKRGVGKRLCLCVHVFCVCDANTYIHTCVYMQTILKDRNEDSA